jgi:xylose isomerase
MRLKNKEYFTSVSKVNYDTEHVKNELSYKFYQPNKVVGSKTMSEHLRIAICYWHNFCWDGTDPFGYSTRTTPWNTSNPVDTCLNKADAVFEFISKLGVKYFTFHDTDIAPYNDDINLFTKGLYEVVDYIENKMQETGLSLLWGTANLFSHKRYLAGGATNPDPEIFACAAMQTKHALEITHRLGGSNYVLWGGREGYDTLLNTDLKKEKEQLARFLSLVVEHKNKIGFKGSLLIEPKPCEPTKHQYDYDTETVYGFLLSNDLHKEFKVNIEANHATLSNHSFEHEVASACSLGLMGSIDANRGDQQNGWDTDQFPNSIEEMSVIMYRLLLNGGFKNGGFNFDTKVRRQSINTTDMFYGHIGGIDILAKSLLIANNMLHEKTIERLVKNRYSKWEGSLGKMIMKGQMDLSKLSQLIKKSELSYNNICSGEQERLENIVTRYIHN